ncbi:MAG: hypothetical protein MPJ05_06450 [Nitrosopumilus sp.]|nr:hypothetical protein [Nitrosopumilus sp.]MDA7945551.1 hypothetical protein [Nitrosopumilus sp.]MDA7953440.1 hypothetical protein [Nitrosopumilus sp.]MDA7974088.1 hypothetical protein [Nitrosopumilus sp.]MDA7997933.1 hypothetical protein [Nitrosopumilus sp.]
MRIHKRRGPAPGGTAAAEVRILRDELARTHGKVSRLEPYHAMPVGGPAVVQYGIRMGRVPDHEFGTGIGTVIYI